MRLKNKSRAATKDTEKTNTVNTWRKPEAHRVSLFTLRSVNSAAKDPGFKPASPAA